MNRTFIKGFLAGNALLIAGLAATAIGIKTKVINPIKKKEEQIEMGRKRAARKRIAPEVNKHNKKNVNRKIYVFYFVPLKISSLIEVLIKKINFGRNFSYAMGISASNQRVRTVMS